MIMVTNNDAIQFLLSPKTYTMRQEKPRHLKYLNEFRTQQCLLFLEQQCQFHRPYTCFHWHFPNQKRRRPFKRPDGTFNYNPDVYCDKYDETSGSCADGDECPYAHRNAGDTERRYHPRYFKTGNCIYETMENGACVKNGLHCAFAHGPDDIRLPVYDIQEVQDASSKFTVNLPASLEKERVLSEDPKWNEMFHVLACYKTELCKKPPRMCRQGYSCPFYHNGKDKRRAPDKFLYRSTPCPIVRPGDEWQDSTLCDTGDACVYCHTRTEQQFHPEIYKSTKCNDVLNSGYCPRGPFCAFAHCDSEMSIGRDFSSNATQQVQYCTTGGVVQSGLIMESNNLSSNISLLSSSSVTSTTTTTISSMQYRHISSDIPLISHTGGSQNQQQQVQHPIHSTHLHHLSTPSAVNSNLHILGTSNIINISNNTNTNSGDSNLPPNLMSNLNTNFSNMTSMIAPSPQQQQHTVSSHPYYQQQQHSMSFPSSMEFNKSISTNTSDHSVRCSHIQNSLMSNVISPLSSNQSSGRGRRLTRCTSPRATSIWPSFNLVTNPNADKQPHFAQLPGQSNPDARIGAYPPTPLGMLSANSVSSTCSSSQNTHFPNSRSRPIPGQFHNVLTHPLAAAAAYNTRDNNNKGRHRSGSSMSSDIGQYCMHTKELTSSPSVYHLSSTSTYPGRCGSYSSAGGSGCMGNLNRAPHPVASSAVSFSTSTQKQISTGMLSATTNTSKSVPLGQLSGIYQTMATTRKHQQQPNILWDNFESASCSTTNKEQYFSPSFCPWPPMNMNTGIDNNNNISNSAMSEMENNFNNFLVDNYQIPSVGTVTSSSIGVCDDTSRDSGLVLDMTLPPTSPLESSCGGGLLSGNFDADLLLPQMTHPTSQQQLASSSTLFDDLHAVYPRFSQDLVFHSPSDDGFLSTHSTSEEQDPQQSFLVTVTSTGGGIDCSSLPNFYVSNPVSIPGKGDIDDKDAKSLQLRSFLDSITCHQSDNLPRCCDSSLRSSTNLQTTSNIVRSPGCGNLIKSSNQHLCGWPSNFVDETEHRHTSPISCPISISNNTFSSFIGTPLKRVKHQPAALDLNSSELTSSVSTNAMLFGAIGSKLHQSMTPESTSNQSDNIQPTILQQCSDCSAQSGVLTVSSTPSPTKLDLGGTRTSSRIFPSHSINENFTNLPQSPILLSSPFSNPGCDLERLTLRRELDEVKQLLDSKEGEVEVLKKQRDFVTEHLRDSLGVIRRLFHSLNMSPSTASTDLFKPLFIDTEINVSSNQSTDCCAHSISSESNPCEIFKTCMQTSPIKSSSPSAPLDSLSRHPLQQQQQEALAALFANPLVSTLLNTQSDTNITDNIKAKSDMQFLQWNPSNNNYPTTQRHESFMHTLEESFNDRLFTDVGTDIPSNSNDDDDDLFSTSGLLSFSNQESCNFDQQFDNRETELTQNNFHSPNCAPVTTASTEAVSEPTAIVTTTTVDELFTSSLTNDAFDESIVTNHHTDDDAFWRTTTLMNSTSASTSLLQSLSIDLDQESDINNNNKVHCNPSKHNIEGKRSI
ncbi:E3 ubiquitin-protein ligase [Schistosoma japonicum]|nr:E3 ubiquitin-protein ligase [Schistosoma japonicum]